MRRSGPPKLESFREAEPPEGAPSVETARPVWEFVSVRLPSVPLPSGVRPRELEDISSSVLRFAIGSTRAAVADTAKQALTAALDVFICAGRDGNPVYINSVFQALARRWSPLFRGTPGGSMWNKKPETLTSARTEMLDAGVDLAKVWTAVCDGIEGLYSVSMIGGPDHARGRSVDLEEAATLEHFEKLILDDPDYKPNPPRVIDRETIAEKNYDVVTIGEPTGTCSSYSRERASSSMSSGCGRTSPRSAPQSRGTAGLRSGPTGSRTTLYRRTRTPKRRCSIAG
jgi:hypothetical protein